MRLSVQDIKAAHVLSQNQEFDPETLLGNPPEFVSFRHPVRVKVTAAATAADIVVTGRAATRMGFTCGRCLENFEKTVESNFERVADLSEEFIDLSTDIRESIFIDLPLSAVCREDCRGICPQCGANRNTAPCRCAEQPAQSQWDALKKFRFH